jgi:hypothetical protein
MDLEQKTQKKLKKTQMMHVLYSCEKCAFSTSNKNDYNRHLTTRKHTQPKINAVIERDRTPLNYVCKCCKKEYQSRNSLWYHEKKCKLPENTLTPIISTNVVENISNIEVMKEMMMILTKLSILKDKVIKLIAKEVHLDKKIE